MPKWAIQRGRIIDVWGRGDRSGCVYFATVNLFSPPRELLTSNLESPTVCSATNLPCLWPLLPFINIKHVYTLEEPDVFRFYSVAFCREHWDGLLNIHPIPDGKSETVGTVLFHMVTYVTQFSPVAWNLWKKFPLQSHRNNCYGCPASSLRMKQTRRWLSGEWENVRLCCLQLLMKWTLKHTLQQDFHLCGDHKFPYCLSHLSWVFYYLQLEASLLINYS